MTLSPQEIWLLLIRDCPRVELHRLLQDVWGRFVALSDPERWSMAALILERMDAEGWYLILDGIPIGMAAHISSGTYTMEIVASGTQDRMPWVRLYLAPHECPSVEEVVEDMADEAGAQQEARD